MLGHTEKRKRHKEKLLLRAPPPRILRLGKMPREKEKHRKFMTLPFIELLVLRIVN